MALLLALLAAFPATRIASLPTGQVLEPGYWQVRVSHRFLAQSDNRGLKENPFSYLTSANVYVSVDRGLPGRVSVGARYNNAGYVAGADAAWNPLAWLTLCAGVGANIREPALGSTWFHVAPAFSHTFARRFHAVAVPRLTASTDTLFVSLGLGAEYDLGRDLSLGLEAEPVLLGPETEQARVLAWGLALDKELGWHNFTLVVGSAWHQSLPHRFSAANRDITQGHVPRIGFNILRKI